MVGANVLNMVAQFVSVRYFYRWVGPEGFGLMVFVGVVNAYVVLLVPNVFDAVQRSLTECLHANDQEGLVRIQQSQALVSLVTVIPVAASVVLLGLFVKGPEQSGVHRSLLPLFALSALTLLVAQASLTLVPIVAALENFRMVAVRSTVEKAATTVSSLLLTYYTRNPIGIIGGYVVGSVLGLAVNVAGLRQMGFRLAMRPAYHRAEVRDMLRLALLAYPHRFLNLLAGTSDRLLYGYSGRPVSELGNYGVAGRVPESIQSVFLPAADIVVPRLTRAGFDSQEAASLLDRYGRFYLAVGVAFVLVPCAFSRSILTLWLGTVPPGATVAVAAFGNYFAIQMYMTILTKVFYASAHLHRAAAFTGLNALLTLAFTIPCARYGGIAGVAVMNACIATLLFVPYAWWVRRYGVSRFALTGHVRRIVAIYALGLAVEVACYRLGALPTLIERPALALVLIPLASALVMASLVASRLTDIPEPVWRRFDALRQRVVAAR